MREIDIRALVHEDSELCAALHEETDLDPWSAPFFSALLQQPSTVGYGAFAPHLVGIVLAQRVDDLSEILTLGVAKEWRRQGLGRRLLHLIMQQAKEVVLEVSVRNNSAFALYQKEGFTIHGRRTGYYVENSEKIDGFILRWSQLLNEC